MISILQFVLVCTDRPYLAIYPVHPVTIVILCIVFLNAIIGFSQEYKAEKAIDELKKMMIPSARVLRDGKIADIESSKLVV